MFLLPFPSRKMIRYLRKWKNLVAGCEISSMNGIRNDPKILTYIRGCPIDFDSEPLSYHEPTNHMTFSSQECEIIDNEIKKIIG